MRLATRSDVLHICQTMWNRGREELNCLGIGPENWIAGWLTRINRGDAVAFGEHAILGCDWESETVCNTAFQASQSFELPGIGRQVTTEMRSAIPELMRGRKASLSLTYSLCIDPESPKWFRLLGLEEDLLFKGERHGEYVMRRFLRRV